MADSAAAGAWTGKRITVMGLGVLGGGVGAARYLASHGAHVTVTDMRDEAALASSVEELRGLPITFHLGHHDRVDFTPAGADIVVRNPGVPMESPYLAAAVESGVPVEMEMSIFFRDCPAPIIGITGTKGKTTVSALIGSMLSVWRDDYLLAGNMGISALMELDRLHSDTPVALELSSFQIEALNDHRLAPQVAVLTNIFPDHLDRYRDFEHYAATKRGLTWSMGPSQVVVFNADDEEASRVTGETPAALMPFGIGSGRGEGAWLVEDELVARWQGQEWSFLRPATLALAGDHGAHNALAAVAACVAYGVPREAIGAGLHHFRGVENRLEHVATIDEVTWVNDTSATNPTAAVAAVRVLAPRSRTLRIIAGGADKKTDLAPFADELAANSVVVYLLDGTVTDTLEGLARERGVRISGRYDSMMAAVSAAGAEAEPGDIVALSPGCASFGMFRNEFDRGTQFRAAVMDRCLSPQVQDVSS
jgi:UDP-N-acetylmuramoylalanine--D-glutamate ligase